MRTSWAKSRVWILNSLTRARRVGERRVPVLPVEDGAAQQVRDRRHQVDVAHQALVHSAVGLARRLHEERHGRDLLHVALAEEAPASHAHLERVAVVRRHDHERATQLAGSPQTVEQLADQVVRVPHLQQVAQLVVHGQVRIVEPRQLVDAVNRVATRRPALAARRQVEPRLVRQEGVLEVEGGPRPATDRPDPVAETRRTPASREAVEDSRPARARAGADAPAGTQRTPTRP